MPAAGRDQIVPLALRSGAAAALGTIPLHRLPRGVQIGYVIVPAALTAAFVYVVPGRRLSVQGRAAAATAPPAVLADDSVEDDELPPAPGAVKPARPMLRLGLSLGFGVVTAGASAAGIWIDHRLERALRSRGVPAPRLVMGAAAGVLTVASVLLDDDAAQADHSS